LLPSAWFSQTADAAGSFATLGDAAATLLRDWPSDDGEEYKTVVKACADAISGEIEPAEFRKRLIRAAGEAGITAFSIVH
jgi:hypothetical protein